MNRKRISLLSTAMIIITLSIAIGYTVYADITTLNEITVTIQNIQLNEVHLTYSQIQFSLLFTNPTTKDITRLQGKFTIYLANSSIGEGNFSAVNIPPQSNTEKSAEFTIYYSQVANAVIEGIQQRDFTLTLHGEIQSHILFDLFTITHHFTTSQSFP